MGTNDLQLEKMRSAEGFIAALDQSGGSTPKALGLYGIGEDAWSSDEEMFDIVHQMRSRIITSPAFNGQRILGAILFENTTDRTIEEQATASYLWDVKKVVPFLKVDKGLAEERDGAQVMKPMPDLDALLAKAKSKNIFGTKMRSVIKQAKADGVGAVVRQQFDVGRRIVAAGLVPIIEPEIDIHCPDAADGGPRGAAARASPSLRVPPVHVPVNSRDRRLVVSVDSVSRQGARHGTSARRTNDAWAPWLCSRQNRANVYLRIWQ